jgi:hypothetical protein
MHRMGPDDLRKAPDEIGIERRRASLPTSAERPVSAPASCPKRRPHRRLPSSLLVPGRK